MVFQIYIILGEDFEEFKYLTKLGNFFHLLYFSGCCEVVVVSNLAELDDIYKLKVFHSFLLKQIKTD